MQQPGVPAGELVTLSFDSRVLRDNPLGDPTERRLHVWLPPGYGRRRKGLPVLFDLVGYTGSGFSHTNWQNFDENVPERLARLTHEGRLGPCILVFPDCFTSLGGNQYINSSAIGRYADYLTRELVPFIDQEFNTLAHRDHRACFGKSSGGYGAMIHGMRYADTWGAIGNHSGDAYFDFIYRSEWPAALTHLQNYRSPPLRDGRATTPLARGRRKPGEDDGRIQRFLSAFQDKRRPSGTEITVLMMLAMAASYDPHPRSPNGFRVPFDLDTGELIEARWRAWLRHDPIHLVKQHAAALRSLRAIYMDCGWRDQYHIHFGSRILSREMRRHRIPHRYDEFNATHSGVDYRMDESLPYLYRAIR